MPPSKATTVTPNLLDRAISWISPGRGLARFNARRALAFAQSFESVKPSRNKRDRSDLGGSGDEHLDHYTLWELREIAESLLRNNGLAVGVMRQAVLNMVGPRGFGFNASTKDDTLNTDIEQAWAGWMATEADPAGEHHGWQLIRQCWRARLAAGDHHLQLDPTGEGKLRSIEAARIVTPAAVETADGHQVIHGIARDRDKRPQWYFVTHEMPLTQHVSEQDGQWYPARNILSMYMPERYSETRGRSLFFPLVREFDDLDDVLLYERIGLKLACSQGIFITVEDPGFESYQRQLETDDPLAISDRLQTVQPGSVNYLRTGQKASLLQGVRPASEVQQFIRLLIRLIGVPLGMPYELVALDFSESTLGTNRSMLQIARACFEEGQFELEQVMSRIYRWWLALQIQKKRFPERPDIFTHQWQPPKWQSPHPLEDAKANEINLRMQVDSRHRIARRRGDDYEQIQEELGREPKLEPKQPATAARKTQEVAA